MLTIATINMGFRQNIIPEDLKMEGTMRTFSKARREDPIARMQKSVTAIGDRYGAKAEVVFTQPYPVTYNDPALSKWVKATLEKASPGKVDDNAALVTGAEDFSMYAEKVPGVFIQLGGRKADASRDRAGQPLALFRRRRGGVRDGCEGRGADGAGLSRPETEMTAAALRRPPTMVME